MINVSVLLLCGYTASELYANYLRIFGLFPPKYFFMACMLLLISVVRRFPSFRLVKPFLFCYITLFVYGIFLDWTNGTLEKEDWGGTFLSLVYPAIILFTFVSLSTKNTVRYTAYTYVFLTCFSSLVSLFQTFDIGPFWSIRDWLNPEHTVTERGVELLTFFEDRPPGLAFTPIHLGYQQVIAGMLGCILHRQKLITTKTLCLIGIFLFLGVYASQTKSAFVAIFFLYLGYYGFFFRIPFLKIAIAAVSLCSVLIIASYVGEESTIQLLKIDASSYSKAVLAKIGFEIFLDNPFGIGSKDYFSLVEEHFYKVHHMEAAESALFYYPHNYIINVMVKHGIVGLIIAILFFRFSLKIGSGEKNYLFNFLIQSSYLIHGLVHNNGPVYSDHLMPLLLSLQITLTPHKINTKEKV